MASNDDDERRRGTPAADGENGNGAARLFSPSFYVFAIAAFAAGAICYDQKGIEVFTRVLAEEADLFLVIFPRIIAALLMAGLIQVLVPQDLVSKWIGRDSGVKGIVIASVAGMLTPGGPLTAFPVMYTLYVAGAHRGALVAYMTGWALLGVQRMLVWELPFLGIDFVLLRYGASFALPILAGLIAMCLPITIEPPRTEG